MKGLFHKKMRRTAGTLMAAVSALVISSCASKQLFPTLPKKPLQAQPSPSNVIKKKKPALSSVWEDGHCGFRDNSVSYYSYGSGKTKTLKLDVKVKGSDLLLCSNSFTVLLAKDTVYVAIGGLDILDGREWFGKLGDRFTWANSYELDLPPGIGAADRIGFATIVENRLRILGGKKAWSIDLGDPFKGWKPY